MGSLKRNKEILLISTRNDEISTEDVFDWILQLGHKPTRINGDDLAEAGLDFQLTKSYIKVGQKKMKRYYDAIWFRRWSGHEFAFKVKEILSKNISDIDLQRNILNYIVKSHQSIKEYFIADYFVSKKWLTKFSQANINKLRMLSVAKSCSLNVPNYIITNKKSDVEDFFKKTAGKLVTKDIDSPFFNFIGDGIYISFTEEINSAAIESLPVKFTITFFQELIEKEFDIRVFYLDGKFYSMAIFSQSNERTKVDFRKNSSKEPNRTVPYKIPDKLGINFTKLMKLLGLTTGSIDLIKDKKGCYYFLEVNPVGQFGMVSKPCNYYLEEKVAEFLTS